MSASDFLMLFAFAASVGGFLKSYYDEKKVEKLMARANVAAPRKPASAGVRYGQSITWRRFCGTRESVTVDDCGTHEEAVAEAVRLARLCGWRPPRRYEFWRWRDTRPVEVAVYKPEKYTVGGWMMG